MRTMRHADCQQRASEHEKGLGCLRGHGWLEGRRRDDFAPGGVDGAADVERGDDVRDGEPDRAVREHLSWADPMWRTRVQPW